MAESAAGDWQQGETGAARLESGTTILVGNAAAGLAMLVGAGYAVLWHR